MTSAISGVMSPRPEYLDSIKQLLCRYLSPFLYLRYQGGVPSTPAPGNPFRRPCLKGRSLFLRSLCPGASISAHITQLIGSVVLSEVEILTPLTASVCYLLPQLENQLKTKLFFTPRATNPVSPASATSTILRS